VPVATKLSKEPILIELELEATARETKTGAVTVNPTCEDTPPREAVIEVDPVDIPVTAPPSAPVLTVAMLCLAEDQVTLFVITCVVPSL
jgi:hypothetical protein